MPGTPVVPIYDLWFVFRSLRELGPSYTAKVRIMHNVHFNKICTIHCSIQYLKDTRYRINYVSHIISHSSKSHKCSQQFVTMYQADAGFGIHVTTSQSRSIEVLVAIPDKEKEEMYEGIKFLVDNKFKAAPDGVPNCVLRNSAANMSAPLPIIYRYFPFNSKGSFQVKKEKSLTEQVNMNTTGFSKIKSETRRSKTIDTKKQNETPAHQNERMEVKQTVLSLTVSSYSFMET
uniref:Uncharacterized protein n=1 Tax=Glossina pallidipes TaxID=7398 RepID=A0A1A9ZS11_GLOPL